MSLKHFLVNINWEEENINVHKFSYSDSCSTATATLSWSFIVNSSIICSQSFNQLIIPTTNFGQFRVWWYNVSCKSFLFFHDASLSHIVIWVSNKKDLQSLLHDSYINFKNITTATMLNKNKILQFNHFMINLSNIFYS